MKDFVCEILFAFGTRKFQIGLRFQVEIFLYFHSLKKFEFRECQEHVLLMMMMRHMRLLLLC
jgi:hypothetical protein